MDTTVRATEVRRHAFSVDEYHRMEKSGLFVTRPRVELVDGEVLEMAAMGSGHVVCVMELTRLLRDAVGSRAVVSVQLPLRLDDRSEPEPDAALLAAPATRYRSEIPAAEDAFLVIEVSDTTLAFDRDVKTIRYGAAGIAECWVVDLEAGEVLVHRGPGPAGYSKLHRASRGEILAIPGLAGSVLTVSEILGPA